MGTHKRNRLIMVMLAAAVWVGCLGFVAYNLLPSHLYWGEPDSARQAWDTQALRAVLPVLEELRVTGFDTRDGCKRIDYSSGLFSDQLLGACVDLEITRSSFTPEAESAFGRVSETLDGSRVWVTRVAAEFDAAGKLIRAEFDLNGWLLAGYYTYVFDPGYTLADGTGGDQRHKPIDSDWYYYSKDWI